MTQKSNLSQYSLFLDKKLVSEFDKVIFPYKRSNVVHQLISEFLDKKHETPSKPTRGGRTQSSPTKKGGIHCQ